jgi:hypothetical protein
MGFAQVRREPITRCMSSSVAERLPYICRGRSATPRHGKPEAVILSFKEWERLSQVPSFGRLLMSAPISPDDLPERDRTPLCAADL